jgi:hypothetical protein
LKTNAVGETLLYRVMGTGMDWSLPGYHVVYSLIWARNHKPNSLFL